MSRRKDFGRELVFSADLCYNGADKKPLPLPRNLHALFIALFDG
jgi:hypothetical protein